MGDLITVSESARVVVDVAESGYRDKLGPNPSRVCVCVPDPWEMQARTRD